jgi:hypothetical protein
VHLSIWETKFVSNQSDQYAFLPQITRITQISNYFQQFFQLNLIKNDEYLSVKSGAPRGVRLLKQIPIRMKEPYNPICRSG